MATSGIIVVLCVCCMMMMMMSDVHSSFRVSITPEMKRVTNGSSHTITCLFEDIDLDELYKLEVVWGRRHLGKIMPIYVVNNVTYKNYSTGIGHVSLPDFIAPSPITGSTLVFPEFGSRHSITFGYTRLSDSTNYSCTAHRYMRGRRYDNATSPDSTLMINDFSQPGIQLYAYDRTGELIRHGIEDKTLTMDCLYSILLPPKVNITLHNGTHTLECLRFLPKYQNVTVCRKLLIMSRYDNGVTGWQCQAVYKHVITKSYVLTIDVKFAPDRVVMVQPLPLEVTMSSRVEIVCVTGTSNPTLEITWMRDDVNVETEDNSERYNIRKFERKGDFNANHMVSVLSFLVHQDLVGSKFQCLLDYIPILISRQTTLKRSVNVSIEGYSQPQREGTDLALTCDIGGGEEAASFMWVFLERGRTTPKLLGYNRTYEKSNATQANMGDYLCRVTFNKKKVWEKSIRVQILPSWYVPEDPGNSGMPQQNSAMRSSSRLGNTQLVLVMVGGCTLLTLLLPTCFVMSSTRCIL